MSNAVDGTFWLYILAQIPRAYFQSNPFTEAFDKRQFSFYAEKRFL